jgi:Lecithin retinol acyltransferase
MGHQDGTIVAADQLAPGTQLIVSRRGYRHHGVYVGNGRVIHYAGRVRYPRGMIEEISLAEFIDGRTVLIGRVPDAGEQVVGRARSRLGERCYDLLRNNCEHFCNWCLLGEPRSSQIESLTWSLRHLVHAMEKLAMLITASMWGVASACKAVRRHTGIEGSLRSQRVEPQCLN